MSISLFIAPHADDEVLGCGGTISKLVEKGETVYVAIMTNANIGAPELFSEEAINLVREESKLAHKLLGVKETYYFDFPAPMLEQYPQYKIAGKIYDLIKELMPKTVYIPHRNDLHLDHGVIFNAALVAIRPQKECSVEKILSYETLSETEWGHPYQDAAFVPNYYEKLTEIHLKKKTDAMSAYKSQLNDFPHPRSLKSIEYLAHLRGSFIGVNAAEAFYLNRLIL